jgi:CheY-like chemotaxis protein
MTHAQDRLSILVVDDNTDSADSMAELLDCMGHYARAAYSGTEALRIVAEWIPNVVILDLLMREMNGWELASRLRQSLSTRHSLMIAMTGCQGDSVRQRSTEAGIDLHLTKPVCFATLQNILERFGK